MAIFIPICRTIPPNNVELSLSACQQLLVNPPVPFGAVFGMEPVGIGGADERSGAQITWRPCATSASSRSWGTLELELGVKLGLSVAEVAML